MTQTKYYSSLAGICMSVMFSGVLEDMAKVYVISVVVFVTVLINLFFRANVIREYIVKRITTDVMSEIFKDSDVRKLLAKKFSEGEKLNENED